MSWRQFDETEPEKRDLELVQGSHYFNHHIPLVLQHGPTCGVALLTSLILTKNPTADVVSIANELLSVAIERGLSRFGELMSPQYMSQMCEFAGLQHQVERVTRDNDLAKMLEDSVLMIIYDKDKNNEPTTLYRGERAHWLLVTGFCYKTKSSFLKPTNSLLKARASSSEEELYVFAQHGKSRLRQLWLWNDILASNENVRQAKPGDWVLPEDFHGHVTNTIVRVNLNM